MGNSKLVLVGGGHAHAIALKLWSDNPLDGVELTLISDVENTPYSGMLPGYVAGFYSYEETHINLSRLAASAGAKLIIDRAIALEDRKILLESGKAVEFDLLSLDTGSTPKTIDTPGAAQYAIPAKPVPVFLAAWESIIKEVAANPKQTIRIATVGGGAGGVELAFNIQARLLQHLPLQRIEITLIHRGNTLLNGHNPKVSKLVTKLMQQRQIRLLLNTSVTQIQSQLVHCDNDKTIPTDYTFWVTQADSPQWIKDSYLAKDEGGFTLVDSYLRSLSHPSVFATGDIASMINYPRPKAGVFAVRQGKPIYTNWRNALTQQPLQPYKPQSKYLALVGTGDKKAIASWGNFCWRSSLLWQLKDYIDRKFMNQFP